jgi:hypothetical protein
MRTRETYKQSMGGKVMEKLPTAATSATSPD